MKATTHIYVKFAAAAVLAAGSGFVQAQDATNCLVSGKAGVYACADGDSPPCNTPYTLNYAGNQLEYNAEGFLPDASEVIGNQNTNVLQLPEFGLTFSKLNGNPGGFNHGVFTNHWGTACGTLVDTSGDGQADELVMQMGGYAGRGGIDLITSFPLVSNQRYPGYWFLKIEDDWTSYQGPKNFFTPVEGNPVEGYKISLSCGSNPVQLALEVNRLTNARGPGPCGPNAIPTLSFWGYATLSLLLMFAGMRLLRNRGFGEDFNLRA